MEKEMKVAVLIDAENISGKYVNVIISEANNLGNVIYKRIYGDWTSSQMSSWKNVVLDNSIQPIQQYKNVSGKNSSDSSLIIDAMDLLYQGRVGAFCIVSSDSDFTRLASRLREAEMYVLGMGEQKTPRSFISACNKFSYLDILYAASLEPQAPPVQEEKPAASEKKSRSGRRNSGKKQAQQASKERCPNEVQQRLAAHLAGSGYAADPLDADDQGTEHQRIDHHGQTVEIDGADQAGDRFCPVRHNKTEKRAKQ